MRYYMWGIYLTRTQCAVILLELNHIVQVALIY
jgi:hypothetical protein